MVIPDSASYLHMPIVRNVPIDLHSEKSWFGKLKKWLNELPNEITMEDFYQILPSECNEILGFSRNIKVCCFIPKGFLFNGASVPKIFVPLYVPNGVLYLGAFLHDFCYSYGGLIVFTEDMDDMIFVTVDQKGADEIFNFMNEEVNDFKTATYPAYLALRGFGSKIWNKCRAFEEFVIDFPDLRETYEKGTEKLKRNLNG